MKRIIVVRHGSYDERSDRLNSHGREQINSLAQIVKEMTDLGSIMILSSTITRAAETAEIIADALSVDLQKLSELSDVSHFSESVKAVCDSATAAETIIAVTHNGQAIFLSVSLLAKSGITMDILPESFRYGEAYLIDFETRTAGFIN